MSEVVAAMVDMQLLTGMRPGEVCIMRGCDLDVSGRIWTYRPFTHKTAHHGKQREVFIGPRAQQVLKPWLRTGLQAFIFSPASAMQAHNERKRQERKTPLWPSHMKHQEGKRKKHRRQEPGDHYVTMSYARAIIYACDWAFSPPEPLAKRAGETKKQWKARLSESEQAELKRWKKEHRWHPNQLRHTAATLLRKEHGIELARIILGHSTAFTTEIYAEADKSQAMEVIGKVG
jgi:integrase